MHQFQNGHVIWGEKLAHDNGKAYKWKNHIIIDTEVVSDPWGGKKKVLMIVLQAYVESFERSLLTERDNSNNKKNNDQTCLHQNGNGIKVMWSTGGLQIKKYPRRPWKESQQMAGNDNNNNTDIFSIRLDENTTPAEEAKLIIYIYIQHTVETKLKQEIMQICKSHTTTPGKDMFCANTCS